MIPKRKPEPGNRRARRAAGMKTIKIKRPPPTSLADILVRLIIENDPSVTGNPGLLMGEKGVVFHRGSDFAYAVTTGKTRVTLHVMAIHCQPELHARYKKLIRNGDFGKGCIRFKPDASVEQDVVAQLIRDCAA